MKLAAHLQPATETAGASSGQKLKAPFALYLRRADDRAAF